MLHAIDLKKIEQNVFAQIGDQWMLITAGTKEACNTMTASWGGLGVLWGKNVATIYIRPQRYTLEFVEASEFFTLSFLGEAYRKALGICGSKSGRDVNKFEECGLDVAEAASGAPYIEQSELVLVCKKLYHHDFDPAHFLDPSIEDCYQNDYHRMYIGEITEALGR